MIFKDFLGYLEGMDISSIPMQYLTAPSKNVIVHKGTAFSRPGITADGANAAITAKKIIGEKVWKDAQAGELPLKFRADGAAFLKWKGDWLSIYEGISNTAKRVRADTWIDDNGDIIKKRLYAVDGTDSIFEWNGGVATVASVDAVGKVITIAENSTMEKLGFDPGNVSAVGVRIIRFNTDGSLAGFDDVMSDSDMTTNTIHVTTLPNTPKVGDLVIANFIKHTTILAGINKDEIYTYKNHVGVANLSSISVYFSDAEVYPLNYTIPASDSTTALTPFLINLDGNFTAMIARYDASLKASVLWISSVDDWIKVSQLDAADSTTGEWQEIEQVAEAERTGAVPFCVAQQKGDIIFLAQDGTLQRITTIDVLAKDTLQLLSDEVETLLPRLNTTDARLYYLKRYIYIVYPAESIVVALDVVENHFQPPWTLPVQCMSVIGGALCGHNNVNDLTFTMGTGTSDLGLPIESVFAFGYYQGFQLHRGIKIFPQDLQVKQKNKTAVSGRMTKSTKLLVEEFFENSGAKATEPWTVDGATATLYELPDDEGWGTHEWGDASIGGEDDPADPVQRVYAFRAYDALAWFEWTAKLTATGADQQFYLLALFINDTLAADVIPDNLYIER